MRVNTRSNQRVKQKRTNVRRKRAPDYGVQSSEAFAFKIASYLMEDAYDATGFRDEQLVKAANRQSFPEWDKAKEPYALTEMSHISPLTPPRQVAVRRQVAAVLDKVCLPGTSSERAQIAIDTCVDQDKVCSAYNRKGYRQLEGTKHLEFMREFVSKVLGESEPDMTRLANGARHGPGSVYAQELKAGLSTYQKYKAWPYSVTRHTRKHAEQLIVTDPQWLGALENSYRERFGIAPWQVLNWDTFWDSIFIEVDCNKITTVPKDRLKDRPIAIEPTMNVYIQLGVDEYIRKRLKRKFNVNLNNQVLNQQLARSGSFDPTLGAPSTIDLSAASDSISLRLVKMLFPPSWWELLCELRSPSGVLPSGEKIRYSKLSSMGNGYTFAVESLIFASCVYAACKLQKCDWFNEPIHVFGDDIIVPERLYVTTVQVLELSGFSVNKSKSFKTGAVKESCGTDWFRAYPIRPVYLRCLPETLQDLFHIHNSLYAWSEEHDVPLDRVLAYIKRVIHHFKGSDFEGPPGPTTHEYVFKEGLHYYVSLRRVQNERKMKDFFFAKLVGLRPQRELAWKEPFLPVRKTGGSVFSDHHHLRWRWDVCDAWPCGARHRYRNHYRDLRKYLTG